MNTTHTVRFELPPSRALRFCVGVAILWALWACRGQISSLVFRSLESSDGLGSVTGIVVPLLIEFVIMLGSLAILISSVGWRVVADVIAGIVQMVRQYRSQSVATQQAATAATEAAQVTAATTAGATAGAMAAVHATANVPAPPIQARPTTIADKIQATLRNHDERMIVIESQSAEILSGIADIKTSIAKPAPRTTTKRTATK